MSRMEKYRNMPKQFFFELLGCVLMAVGVHNFAMAAQLPLSGFSGVAYLMNHLLGIPVGWATVLLNIPLAALCWRLLGKDFLIRSLRCMLISSLMIDYLAPLLPSYQGDRLLAAIAVGLTMGAGIGLLYIRNSTTGGIDFVVMAVKVLRPYLSMGKIVMVTDVLIISVSSMVFGDIDGFIYGLISTYIVSMVIDKMIFGINSGKMALIVTKHGDQISAVIEDTCHRGSTILSAVGGYTKDDMQVVMSVCSTKQMTELQRAVKLSDPAAFTFILDSNEVQGAGFHAVKFGDSDAPPK